MHRPVQGETELDGRTQLDKDYQILNRLLLAMMLLARTALCEPQVLAHYMPWFKAEPKPDGTIAWSHWQWFGKGPKHDPNDILPSGQRDIASVYYPLAGPYDGRDPLVLEYHMLSAKAAGIEGFVADWYGPGEYTDQVFAGMVKAAEQYRMKVAICLEEKSFFPPYSKAKSRAEAMEVMRAQVRHVISRYGSSPAYLRRAERPVFFIFPGWEQTALGPNTFSADEMREFREDILLVGPDAYVWTADGQPRQPRYEKMQAARKSGQIGYWVGGVCPGFNDTGVWGWGNGPRITDRRGTAEYEEQWQDVLRYRPDAVQVITWNDFGEGTTIEPAEPYQFTFVDATERFVEKFTGRRARLDDHRWGYRLLQLRRKVEAMPERAAWTRRLDEFARAFAAGRRWRMERRLAELERQIGGNK
jgi:hypothetical protein